MSSQKGNTRRLRPQKHQNAKAFNNSLHDTSKRTKTINTLQADGCCARCRDVIEWKIKYKKYKQLTVAKKCIKCDQKTVKKAYCTVCIPCAAKLNICMKCAKNEDIAIPVQLSDEAMLRNQAQLEQELKFLPERKRRTFLRLQATGKLDGDDGAICGTSGEPDDSDDSCEVESDDGPVEDLALTSAPLSVTEDCMRDTDEVSMSSTSNVASGL